MKTSDLYNNSPWFIRALTNGELASRVENLVAKNHSNNLTCLAFDDASTTTASDIVTSGLNTVIGPIENGVFTPVPEPSSLSLGTGELITRRRREAA